MIPPRFGPEPSAGVGFSPSQSSSLACLAARRARRVVAARWTSPPTAGISFPNGAETPLFPDFPRVARVRSGGCRIAAFARSRTDRGRCTRDLARGGSDGSSRPPKQPRRHPVASGPRRVPGSMRHSPGGPVVTSHDLARLPALAPRTPPDLRRASSSPPFPHRGAFRTSRLRRSATGGFGWTWHPCARLPEHRCLCCAGASRHTAPRCGASRAALPPTLPWPAARHEACALRAVRRSTPGRFSTDESVACDRRFQLPHALHFHGLWSPPRSGSDRSPSPSRVMPHPSPDSPCAEAPGVAGVCPIGPFVASFGRPRAPAGS